MSEQTKDNLILIGVGVSFGMFILFGLPVVFTWMMLI